jgi:hypothetical protein
MPAPDETTDDPVTPEASSPDEREQADAGVERSSRRRRRLVGGAVLVAVLVIALRAAGVGGDGGSGDDDGERDQAGSTTTATSEPAESSTSASGVTIEPGPSTTVAPPDVARARPPVDLATPPPGDDAVEVARWWASVFVAYEGAEPMPDLVARLSSFTTPRLQAELQAVPPAASYDVPLEVAGASAQPAPAAAGGQRVQVTVETAGALVIYELALVPGPGGGWQADQANRRV